MFQFILFLAVTTTGQGRVEVLPEQSFNTYQECADSIPDTIIARQRPITEAGAPIVIGLGCLKTGEKS
jgi:hypothetical protein